MMMKVTDFRFSHDQTNPAAHRITTQQLDDEVLTCLMPFLSTYSFTSAGIPRDGMET